MQRSILVIENPELALYIRSIENDWSVTTGTLPDLLSHGPTTQSDVLVIDMTRRGLSTDLPDINTSYGVPLRMYVNGDLLIVSSDNHIAQYIALSGTGEFYFRPMSMEPETIRSCNELLRTGFPITPLPRPILPVRYEDESSDNETAPNKRTHEETFSWITGILSRELLDEELVNCKESKTILRGFIDRFSHDIGTPISSLKTGIESLMNGDTANSGIDQEEMVRDLLDHVLRIDELRKETLMLNKFDSGTVVLRTKLTSIHPLVQDVYLKLLPKADAKEQSMVFDCPHISVELDEEKIRSVLENLIGNAIKYTQSGGTISSHVETNGKNLRISIIDDGPGVPEGSEQVIFQRFTRVHKHIAGGTGLGLSIVRSIVTMHGGTVWYEPGEPGGSRFIVELPIRS